MRDGTDKKRLKTGFKAQKGIMFVKKCREMQGKTSEET